MPVLTQMLLRPRLRALLPLSLLVPLRQALLKVGCRFHCPRLKSVRHPKIRPAETFSVRIRADASLPA